MMDEKRLDENTQVEDQVAETLFPQGEEAEKNFSELPEETPAMAEEVKTEENQTEVTQEELAEVQPAEESQVEAEEVAQVEEASQEEAAEESVSETAPEVEESQPQVAEEAQEPATEEATEPASEEEAAPEEVQEEKPEEEMTMEELMQKYDHPVRVGQIITGKIIQLDDKEAIIGLVGAGNDGKLSVDEVSFDDNAKMTELMEIGQDVEAKIIRRPIENDSFYILSVKEVQREASKDELLDILGKDDTIAVRVKEAVKGGLVAFYKGHRIFIPASHVDVHSVRDLTKFEGEEIDINVIEAEERRGSTRIVGSRKRHLLKAKEAQEAETWENLEVDQVRTGRVERLTDFGAFINIDGVDGLLHISEITHGKIPKPSNVLKVGEDVEVKIINLDKERKRMSLSMKALQPDPWENISEKYPNESIVLGKVVRFTDFGAFIELEPGVDGLAHISQLSHTRVEKPSEVLTIGDTIKVMVLDSNEKDKKVSLSVKAID